MFQRFVIQRASVDSCHATLIAQHMPLCSLSHGLISNSLQRERPATLRRLGCLSHARRRFLPQSSLGKAVNYFLKEDTVLVGSCATDV